MHPRANAIRVLGILDRRIGTIPVDRANGQSVIVQDGNGGGWGTSISGVEFSRYFVRLRCKVAKVERLEFDSARYLGT